MIVFVEGVQEAFSLHEGGRGWPNCLCAMEGQRNPFQSGRSYSPSQFGVGQVGLMLLTGGTESYHTTLMAGEYFVIIFNDLFEDIG